MQHLLHGAELDSGLQRFSKKENPENAAPDSVPLPWLNRTLVVVFVICIVCLFVLKRYLEAGKMALIKGSTSKSQSFYRGMVKDGDRRITKSS